MSEPKRLEFIKSADCDMGCDCRLIPDPIECKDGRFVFYRDYARLKAEVERLRKAGDAMFYNLLMAKPHVPDNGNTHHMIDASILGWNPKYGTTE